MITAPQLIEAAKKQWPDAVGFKVDADTWVWSVALGMTHLNCALIRYVKDCDGDELGTIFSGSSLEDILTRIKSTV